MAPDILSSKTYLNNGVFQACVVTTVGQTVLSLGSLTGLPYFPGPFDHCKNSDETQNVVSQTGILLQSNKTQILSRGESGQWAERPLSP